MGEPVYRRVIVKLSGEALAGAEGFGIRQATIERLAADLVAAHALGTSLGVVVGGGNMFRGIDIAANGVSRASGAAGTLKRLPDTAGAPCSGRKIV